MRRADRRLDAADREQPAHAGLRLPLPSTTDRDTARHEARKAYKRARYAVEVLRPVVGRPAKRLAKRLTALQDVLGAYQDGVVAAQLLRDYGMRAHQDGDNAFTYGLLYARQRAAEPAGLNRARRRATGRRVRRFLD